MTSFTIILGFLLLVTLLLLNDKILDKTFKNTLLSIFGSLSLIGISVMFALLPQSVFLGFMILFLVATILILFAYPAIKNK